MLRASRRNGATGPEDRIDRSMHPQQISIFRAMSPARKLELAADFHFAARHLKSQSLKALHPDWSNERVRRKVREMFLYAAS